MTTADKLRGLMEGATRGTWKRGLTAISVSVSGTCDTIDCSVQSTIVECLPCFQEDNEGRCWATSGSADGNRNLIVASVNLLPALAAVVEAGNAAVAKLRTLHYGEPVGRDDAKVVWDLKESLSALDAAVSREVG